MKRLTIVVLWLLILGAPVAIAQETVDVADLLEAPADYVGEISVVGELIGDYGFRSDDSVWTQLNDDSYAFDPVLDSGQLTGGNVGVAVRIPAALTDGLDPPGGYRVRGPVVAATGVWKYHDPDRGGETYIDVVALTVVESGRGLSEHPNWLVGAVGLTLIVSAGFVRRWAGPRRG